MQKQRPPEPLLITTAQPGHLQEVHDRQVQYTITMAIRTACLLLAIVVPGWTLKGIAIGGAAILPWVAVQAANLPYRTARNPRTVSQERPALEAGKPELGPPAQSG